MIDHRPLGKSFLYAFEGVHYALKHNQNLRIHFAIAILVLVASVFLKVSPLEMAILGVMILLVISTEMINAAIEQMVDLIVTEHRKEAKIAKDVAAGMVLVTSIGSVIVGVIILTPYIIKLFSAASFI